MARTDPTTGEPTIEPATDPAPAPEVTVDSYELLLTPHRVEMLRNQLLADEGEHARQSLVLSKLEARAKIDPELWGERAKGQRREVDAAASDVVVTRAAYAEAKALAEAERTEPA